MTTNPPLLAGARVPAGLTHSTIQPELDFETYSEAGQCWTGKRWTGPVGAPKGKRGLPVVGAAVYAKHPSTRVLTLAYDLKDGLALRFWCPGRPIPHDLFEHVTAGRLLEAWNVGFERWIWEEVCVKRMGWPPVQPAQWRCAMAKARAHALPGGLDKVGAVLGLAIQKDAEGTRLLDKFSVPQSPTQADPRTRHEPLWTQEDVDETLAMLTEGLKGAKLRDATQRVANDVADTQGLGRYNLQDVAAEGAASLVIPDLSATELRNWQDDQDINHRGVRIDMESVHNCVAIFRQAERRYGDELATLTGGIKPTEVAQLIGWLHARGVHTDSLDEEAIEGLLKMPLDPTSRRVIEVRAAVSSASVKKLFALVNQTTPEGRLHDTYVFHGARTGRPTGAGVQTTNLPKAGPTVYLCECGRWHGAHTMTCHWCGKFTLRGPAAAKEWNPAAMKDALIVISHRSLDWVETVFGDALLTLAGVLRGLFIAAEGCDLLSSDFTAIEGVVIACIAGEQWRIDAFANDAPMYLLSAERMFGVSVGEMKAYAKANGHHHPLRQKGKGGELACFGPDTQVLTGRGYVRIVDVELTDKLWDGEEWVSHAGVIPKGKRAVVGLDGIEVTPQHLCLSGSSWKAASQLASCASTLSRALETGSANLPWLARPRAAKTLAFASSAVAGASRTLSRSQVSGPRPAPDAKSAACLPQPKRAASGWTTTPWSPTPRTATAFCPASPVQSQDATGRRTPSSATTGAGAFACAMSGGQTAEHSWPTWSRRTGGTTRLLKWIGRMLTEGMSPATSDLSAGPRTKLTGERSETCSDECLNLKNVYDVAHAGPRNRFTVRTNSGHLIVHNCGFGGWISSLRAFGVGGSDDELKDTVIKWRDASPALVHLWGGQKGGPGVADRWAPNMHGLEGMAILAVQNPGEKYEVTRLDGKLSGVAYLCKDDVLYCRVPSGGLITYHRPRLCAAEQTWRGQQLSFEGWNTNPKSGPPGWIRMNTYSGKLAENVVQKTARDKQMSAINRVQVHDFPVVMHTYDEIVAEVPKGFGSVEELERLMTTPEPWNEGWPLKAAGGWRDTRYQKA